MPGELRAAVVPVYRPAVGGSVRFRAAGWVGGATADGTTTPLCTVIGRVHHRIGVRTANSSVCHWLNGHDGDQRRPFQRGRR